MIALLLEAALRSLVLGLVVWLAMQALRPRNPHLHKTVWVTVLIASVAMPLVLQWRIAPSIDVPTYLVSLTQAGAAGGAAARLNESSAAGAELAALPIRAITILYAVISFALVARFALALFCLWRIRAQAVPVNVEKQRASDVRASSKVLSPATFGSTILLPANWSEWSEAKLATVLSHERSHVRHKDCYVQWLAHFHATIFWFNPLAWWLQRRLAQLAETTSDDAVIEEMSDRTARCTGSRMEYADLLLDISRHQHAGRVVMNVAGPNISARIERIISNVPPSRPPRRWVRALAVAMLIPPFTMAAATLQAPGTAPGSTATPTRAQAQTPTPATSPDESWKWNSPADASDPMKPRIIDIGDLADMEKNYPVEAKRHGVDGLVTITVTLDPAGRVMGTLIVDEFPNEKDWGFGAAASYIAHTMKFSNPLKRTTQLTFRVKFELDKSRPPPPIQP